jgi:hypothetical protein
MQSFKNADLSAPTSFLVLASFKQAVRLACFAASLAAVAALGALAAAGAGAGAVAAAVAAAGVGVWVIARCTANNAKPRPRALAAIPRRMTDPSKKHTGTDAPLPRVTSGDIRPDEARMKLR